MDHFLPYYVVDCCSRQHIADMGLGGSNVFKLNVVGSAYRYFSICHYQFYYECMDDIPWAWNGNKESLLWPHS